MSFTRQNTSQSTSISRGNVSSTINTPAFQTFNVDTSSTKYSLGNNWGINVDTNNTTLSFQYNNFSVLTLNQTGFSLSSFTLPSQSTLPSAESGTILNYNNNLYVYTD